jgi:hypothetical protein
MRLALASLIFALTLSFGCSGIPTPNVSPQAKVAFYGAQVIRDLDILRDTVVAAEKSVPQIISTPAARRYIAYHRFAIMMVHDAPSGYQAVVQRGLDEYTKSLTPQELVIVGPYAALITLVLQEVQ